jgi:hypothetical protein
VWPPLPPADPPYVSTTAWMLCYIPGVGSRWVVINLPPVATPK